MGNLGITMIGTSGTGKTCYLYAMYSDMCIGRNGFAFRPIDDDQGFDLEEGWDTFLAKREWPPRSDMSTEYGFCCTFSAKPIQYFTWYDYRGGILTDKETGDDREAFYKIMKNSGALIMCVSADLVLNAKKGDGDARNAIKRYPAVLSKYYEDNKRTVPVTIVITKADMFESKDQSTIARTYLIERVFHEVFVKDGGWMVMVTGVSLGNLSNENGKVIGEIEVVNVHFPVLFSVYATLLPLLSIIDDQLFGQDKSIDKLKGDLYKENNRSLFGRWYYKEEREDLKQKLDSDLETKKRLIENKDLIKKNIDRILEELLVKEDGKPICDIYFNGEKKW